MILNDELKRISISWLMSEHAPGRSKDSSDKPQDSQPRNRELNLWHTEHEAMMLSIAQERPVLLWGMPGMPQKPYMPLYFYILKTSPIKFLNVTSHVSGKRFFKYEMWLWSSRNVSYQAYLYTYNLLRGVTFEVLPLSNYAFSQTMLPLLETFLELLLWNSFQCHRHFFFLDVFSILKSSQL